MFKLWLEINELEDHILLNYNSDSVRELLIKTKILLSALLAYNEDLEWLKSQYLAKQVKNIEKNELENISSIIIELEENKPSVEIQRHLEKIIEEHKIDLNANINEYILQKTQALNRDKFSIRQYLFYSCKATAW